MKENDLKKGTLVEIRFINKYFTEEGFATISMPSSDNTICALYEKIDLESFPSFRDFKGKISYVKEGSKATVLGKIGRPYKLSNKDRWCLYDVYSVLLESSEVRQVFKHNLKKVK